MTQTTPQTTANPSTTQIIRRPRCPVCNTVDVRRTCSRLPIRYYTCRRCVDRATGDPIRFKVFVE